MRHTFFFNVERQACWEAVNTYFYGFGLTRPWTQVIVSTPVTLYPLDHESITLSTGQTRSQKFAMGRLSRRLWADFPAAAGHLGSGAEAAVPLEIRVSGGGDPAIENFVFFFFLQK